ncbi:MAG: hypothetical protein F6K28_41350 [Microcoleus sp. SIO2G3]|nr:hypothetical protein [Microcoleus sp. SIO2G3]
MSLRTNTRELPEGWIEKKLGDVCEKVEYGSSAKSQLEGKIPVLRMGNIQNGSIDWSDLVYTTNQEEIDKYLLKYNDVLFNRTNSDEHVGKTAIYKGERPAIFAEYLIRIHRKEDLLDADFLNYYLNSNTTRKYGKSVMSRSVNQANINGTKLKEYPIVVPPLPEQKRIVAIVDKAFEGIDRAIANTEKNLTNTRELFESYLDAIFVRKGNDWVEKRLTEIGGKVLTGPFGSLLHKSDYVSNGVPLVNPANIEGDRIIPDFNKTVDQDALNRLQAYILKENDIVVGRRGEIGRCSVVRKEQSGWLCGTGCFFIQPFKYTNPVFLAHLLRSTIYRNKLELLATGATMKNLSNQSLSSLVIALPGLDEQNRIINKLNDSTIETRRLETIYQQKLAALNELKQSILQKAFSGELTADTTQQATETAKEVAAA